MVRLEAASAELHNLLGSHSEPPKARRRPDLPLPVHRRQAQTVLDRVRRRTTSNAPRPTMAADAGRRRAEGASGV